MKSICTSCKHKDACDRDRRIIGYPNFRVTECKEYERKGGDNGMTREEAREALSVLKIYDAQWLREAVDMAIEALHREEAEEKGYCHRIRPSNVEVVVRCQDCKHWKPWICSEHNVHTHEDDFCSFGERREEGGNE